jgi:hypothetical protein
MVSVALLTAVVNNAATLSPQQVADYEHYLKTKREGLTLLRAPITTLYLFFRAILAFLLSTIHYITTHWIFLFLCVPLGLLWYIQVIYCILLPYYTLHFLPG